MKLIITRQGSTWGGPVGSAVIDLDNETICYFDCKVKNTGDITKILIKFEEEQENRKNVYEEIKNKEVDLGFLKEELSKDLGKDITKFGAFDAQEDYVIFDNDEKVELVYREDNEASLRLKNREVNGMLRKLIELVR